MSIRATTLKYGLIESPDEDFEPLTFGELEKGDKFISLPLPGDNNGQGGFRGSHYIFTKTDQCEAVNNRGASSFLPESMFVIKVE